MIDSLVLGLDLTSCQIELGSEFGFHLRPRGNDTREFQLVVM